MNKIVIVGGSRGIGKEIINQLVDDNMIINLSRNKPELTHTNLTHYNIDILSSDLPDLEGVSSVIYCPGSINLKPFKRFTDEDFISDFKLQVVGATKIITILMPRLAKGGNSSIVLFSTIAVQNGFNFHSQVAVSKGAIEGLTRSLAAELAPKIRVNAVAPSLTDTSLASKFLNTPQKIAAQAENNPLKKIGTVKDVAEAAAYLVTDKSSWTTGQILHVDGGYSTIK